MNIIYDYTFKDFFVDESNGEEQSLPMANMDQVVSTINLYENITNRRLYVYKSSFRFREYRCRCHCRCIFRANFRLRRSDNQLILSSAIFYHLPQWTALNMNSVRHY